MNQFDIQGHRGYRGLYPENTIPAFEAALKLGVTTLEMDVVITGDNKVLVSHEPFMSHEICLDPSGNEIPENKEQQHNIFKMTLEEVGKYDCGSKSHPRFPHQKKMKVFKPLLSDVIQFAEAYAVRNNSALPFYNIEIKSTVEWEQEFHPHHTVYADLLVNEILAAKISERTTIQSFDVRPLRYLKKQAIPVKLALLVENTQGAVENISELGFSPDYYSPDFHLLTAAEVKWLHSKHIGILPWTVNESHDMTALMELGVDGIITDYPEKLIALMKSKK